MLQILQHNNYQFRDDFKDQLINISMYQKYPEAIKLINHSSVISLDFSNKNSASSYIDIINT